MSVWVCSDLHGMYDIYEQIVDFIKPGDKVVCLGDCGDRGYRNWDLIKAVYNNPQFTYLKGNHEDMLVAAMESYFAGIDDTTSDALYILQYNGGGRTFREWKKESPADRRRWYKRLKDLPLKMDYYCAENGTIWHLTHAGYTPYQKKELSEYRALWDRDHFLDEVNAPDEDEAEWDEVCVHGHTPLEFLAEELHIDCPTEPGIIVYGDDHKIDIDNGSFYHGYAVLLNLDTCEYVQFYDRSEVTDNGKHSDTK